MALEKLPTATAGSPAPDDAPAADAILHADAAVAYAGAAVTDFIAMLGRLPVVPADSLPMLCASSSAPSGVEPPTLMPAHDADATPSCGAQGGSAEPPSAPILFGAWGLPGMCVPTLQPPAPQAARSASAAPRQRSRSKQVG